MSRRRRMMYEPAETTAPARADSSALAAGAPGVRRRGLRLQWSVLLALVVGLALPNLYFLLSAGRSAEARALTTLRGDLDQVTDILAAAMRDPLWQLAPDLGRPLLQAMFRDERLVAVTVRETNAAQPFLDIYRSVSVTAPALSRSRAIVFDGRELGTISVTMSTGPMLTRYQSDLEATLWHLGLSVLSAAVFVAAMVHWRLIRPLRRWREILRGHRGGDSNAAVGALAAPELQALVDDIDGVINRDAAG